MSLIENACALIDLVTEAFASFKTSLNSVDWTKSVSEERIEKLQKLVEELKTLEDFTGGALNNLVEEICEGEDDESNS